MSQPTKEQWVEITQKIDRSYECVRLRCDEYLLSILMQRDKNKLITVVYVNGKHKGQWYMLPTTGLEENLSDIQRRFCKLTWVNKFPRKLILDMEKIIGKRRTKKEGFYDKRMRISAFWPSAKSLVSHLKKHNKNIEVLTHDEYKAALDALPKEEAA